MNRETVTAHSKNLGKDMSVRVYGESGWPIVAFPIQDAMSDSYEQFGMVDAMKDYIEGGKVQLFVLDSVDAEGWSDRGGDNVLRVKVIEAFYNYVCEEVVPFEKARTETIRARILDNLSKLGVEVDRNRLEQEMIYYLEKLDITEEKVRLENHCRYFREVAAGEEAPGRKLGFIAQEMGREINTMGSKANESNIQILVVRMKDELEKIKEQVLNIL